MPTATAVPAGHVARYQLTAAVLRLLAAEHADESTPTTPTPSTTTPTR